MRIRSLLAVPAVLLVSAAASADVLPASTEGAIAGEVVVDFKDDVSASDVADVLAHVAGRSLTFAPTALEGETKIEVADVPIDVEDAVIAALAADPRVENVEPLGAIEALFTPDDPLYAQQWHMERVGAKTAWDYGIGRGITVAVVDTGIACEAFGDFHKATDLADTRCVPGWNFVAKNEHANDDQSHGTHVAGTIAQSTDNGLGGVGLAFGARLMPVKVLDANGSGTTANVADGIRWAADHGAQVINLSLGGPLPSRVLQAAVDHARAKGAVVVAAAGNSGGRVGYPGGSNGVVCVSATDDKDKIAKFSSRGDAVDLAAPGVAVIQQTICNRGRNKCEGFPAFSGTSMATPHVAGIAAILEGEGVTDPDVVERTLKQNARVVDTSDGAKKLYGAGILDGAATLRAVTLKQGLTRLAALVVLAGLALVSARKKNKDASVGRLSVLGPALLAGPGLFFLPMLVSRAALPVDVLSRPLADWDLVLLGPAVHGWLPFANAVVPFALTALLFGIKGMRPIVAGLSLGIGAYLASAVVLGQGHGPLGHVAMLGWCAVNALAATWIGRVNLAEEK